MTLDNPSRDPDYYRRKYNIPKPEATVTPLVPREEPPSSTSGPVADVAEVAQFPERSRVNVADSLEKFLGRFIAYPNRHSAAAHTLWIIHAPLVEEFDNTPRIAFLSPEPGSGKSRAIEVTELLVPNAVATINATVSYIFRRISKDEGDLPTLLFDEVDAIFNAKRSDGNEDLRGLLNSGYRKGATVGRTVLRGKELIPEDYPSFCPVALAGLNDLPETLMTRSIVIPMKKRRPDQTVEPFRRRFHSGEAEELRIHLAELVSEIRSDVRDVFPELPKGIEDRHADKWEPLIAIADALGGKWPELAREAALAFVAESKRVPLSIGVRLLVDIQKLLEGRDRIASQDLVDQLRGLDESEWATLGGNGIDQRWLARQLKKYEIQTEALKFDRSTLRGYRADAFADAFSRYLSSPEEVQPPQPVQPVEHLEAAGISQLPETCPLCGEAIHPELLTQLNGHPWCLEKERSKHSTSS